MRRLELLSEADLKIYWRYIILTNTITFTQLNSDQLVNIVGGSKKHHPWYWSIEQFGKGFLNGLAS